MQELKRKDAPPPFSDFYVYETPVYHKKQKRYYIFLVNKVTKKVTSVSYAKYLMCLHLGRILDSSETVDHINNDRTDDRIENLQILSQSENSKKFIESRYVGKSNDLVELTCSVCGKIFLRKKKYVRKDQPAYCSRSCVGKYCWESGLSTLNGGNKHANT